MNRVISIYDPQVAVDPIQLTPLSSTGQPTESYTLNQNYPTAVLGFKVPQGVRWQVLPFPFVKMYLFQNATTQLSPADTIYLYSKAPYDTTTNLGTLICTVKYNNWFNAAPANQGLPQYSTRLQLPIEQGFVVYQNYVLIFAVATLLSGEQVNWTYSYVELPVVQTLSS
jgi:hypothetical protein